MIFIYTLAIDAFYPKTHHTDMNERMDLLHVANLCPPKFRLTRTEPKRFISACFD
jgi:hypothetical protein